MLMGQHFLAEPGSEVVGILDRCLPEPQGLPDLRAVELNRPTGPVVLRVELRRDAELLRDMDDRQGGDVASVLRETPLVVVILEQQGAAEACGDICARPRRMAWRLVLAKSQPPLARCRS
jgi:hypothetical protein